MMKKVISLLCAIVLMSSAFTIASASSCGHGETTTSKTRSYRSINNTQHKLVETEYCHCSLCGYTLWTNEVTIFTETHQRGTYKKEIRGDYLYEYWICLYCNGECFTQISPTN